MLLPRAGSPRLPYAALPDLLLPILRPRTPPTPPPQVPPETEQERLLKEEADIMRQVTQKQALKTYKELAKDISYSRSINTGWKPPLKYRLMSDEEHQVGPGLGLGWAGLVAWGEGGGDRCRAHC